MYRILDEIRDLMVANTVATNTAESGTTATNIKITGHGLILGDKIINATRSNAERLVTAVIDADNFTVDSVASQTATDIIKFPKFKKYYVGKLNDKTLTAVNSLPVFSIYGNSTDLAEGITLQKDIYKRNLTIEIYTSAFAHASENEDDGDLQAQKTIWNLMEELNTDAVPSAQSILGVLRRNIRMGYSLFNNDIQIKYDELNPGNALYFRGTMTFSVTIHNSRS